MSNYFFDPELVSRMKQTIISALKLRNPEVLAADMKFVGVEEEGRIAFEIPRWLDLEIEARIKRFLDAGENNMTGRCTWGTMRFGEKAHVPVVIAVFGTEARSVVAVCVNTSFWTERSSHDWLTPVLERSTRLLGRSHEDKLPEMFMMPKVMLWDGNREILPRMLGYTFIDSAAASGALSRIFWPLHSYEKSGIFAVEARHQEESIGTLHVSQYEDGFFGEQSGGGWMYR